MTTPIRIEIGAAWPVVAHRLEAGGAIADALTDHAEDEEPARPESREAIEAAVDSLHARGCAPPHVVECSELDLHILADCLDGAVMFADSEEHIAFGLVSRSTVNKYKRAARTLAATLSALLGEDIELAIH